MVSYDDVPLDKIFAQLNILPKASSKQWIAPGGDQDDFEVDSFRMSYHEAGLVKASRREMFGMDGAQPSAGEIGQPQTPPPLPPPAPTVKTSRREMFGMGGAQPPAEKIGEPAPAEKIGEPAPDKSSFLSHIMDTFRPKRRTALQAAATGVTNPNAAVSGIVDTAAQAFVPMIGEVVPAFGAPAAAAGGIGKNELAHMVEKLRSAPSAGTWMLLNGHAADVNDIFSGLEPTGGALPLVRDAKTGLIPMPPRMIASRRGLPLVRDAKTGLIGMLVHGPSRIVGHVDGISNSPQGTARARTLYEALMKDNDMHYQEDIISDRREITRSSIANRLWFGMTQGTGSFSLAGKTQVTGPGYFHAMMDQYRRRGQEVLPASAQQGYGVLVLDPHLQPRLAGKPVTYVHGPSISNGAFELEPSPHEAEYYKQTHDTVTRVPGLDDTVLLQTDAVDKDDDRVAEILDASNGGSPEQQRRFAMLREDGRYPEKLDQNGDLLSRMEEAQTRALDSFDGSMSTDHAKRIIREFDEREARANAEREKARADAEREKARANAEREKEDEAKRTYNQFRQQRKWNTANLAERAERGQTGADLYLPYERSLRNADLLRTEKLFKSLFKGRGKESRNQGMERRPSVAEMFDSFPIDRLVTNPGAFENTHRGVFGENRGVYIEVSPSDHHGYFHQGEGPLHPRIDYLQLRPGATVGPKHVQAFFDALHLQGYDGDTMHFLADDDADRRTDANGLNRRERLFRPLKDQWKRFVAAKQDESAEPSEPPVSKSYKTPVRAEKLFKSLFKGRGEESRNQEWVTEEEESRNQELEGQPSIAKIFDSLPIDRLVTNPGAFENTHHGVFGENRGVYIRVSPSNDRGEFYQGEGPLHPRIDYLQLRPGATVGPKHVQAVFDALHRQGYDGDTMHFFARKDADGRNRRERLFRPLKDQWKEFVAAKVESASEVIKSYEDMPLHELYNELSKAYKTPAWQRKWNTANLGANLYLPYERSLRNADLLRFEKKKSKENMTMKRDPFPLQLKWLAKAAESEQWIAPGGEHFHSKKSRMFFLDMARGNADDALILQERAIKEHNALYLADKQPRGMTGIMIPSPEERASRMSSSYKLARDPADAVSKFNSKENWSPHEGETQDQANARMDAHNKEKLEDSLVAHTDPHTVSADPNNSRQWKYHGLQNSFANSDAYDDVPLHKIYGQISKAYKTPAWQRKEGQNPKGGLNAKGRASAKAEGHNLKAPVKSGDNPRRASFLARMGNSPGPEYDEHGKPTRLLLSLQAWGASSKADARRKAKAISARLKKDT